MMHFHEAALQMSTAMHQVGIVPLEDVTARLAASPGTLIRFRCQGDRRGRRNGYAIIFLDAAGGAFGHWATQVRGTWKSKGDQIKRQPKDVRAINYRLAAQQDARREGQRRVASEAERLLKNAKPANPAHSYLVKKGLPPIGLYQGQDILIAPITDVYGKLWSLQRIFPDGAKLFLPGSRRPRTFWSVGLELDDDSCNHPERIYIGEGVATMLAVHLATGNSPVVAAMDAHSLEACARAIRSRFSKSTLIICADDDAATQARMGRNPGIEAATAAAAAVGGLVLQPHWRTI